jgi:hypothetical protein
VFVFVRVIYFPKKLVIFALPSFAGLFAAVLLLVALLIFLPPTAV